VYPVRVAPTWTERRLAAILFSDIVGYTALMGRDEAAGRRVRARHRALVGRLAPAYGGELVDENGDELVVCFASAVDAVNCALRVQEELRGDAELSVRTGAHTGDCVFEDGRVYGDGVNLAARVRAFAEPGGVAVTSEIRQAVRNQPNLESRALGEQRLKGVESPVALYVVRGTPGPPHPRTARPARRRSRVPALPVALALGVLAAATLGWWLARPAPESAPIRSLAVLPLENLSGDPEQEFFADGMTEALILELARVSSLKVISRTSVMPFKEARRPLDEIAAALDVDAVIEGSVLRQGDRVRVTAQLVDARSDAHIWAERYDGTLRDILALQSEIASAVAHRVDAELAPELERRFRGRPSADPAAHDEYLKGLHFAQKHTPPAALRAREHFERAMELAPDYPLPYAGLADTLSCSPLHTWAVPAEGTAAVPEAVMDEAHALATRAISLDENLPEAQTALGLVDMFRRHDWQAAERRFRRALDFNHNYEFAWRAYTVLLLLQGRLGEAKAAIGRALDIDPLSPFAASLAGDVYEAADDVEEAMAAWRESYELDAAHPLGPQGLGRALCRQGRLEEARAHFERARKLSHDDPLVLGDLGHCLASTGRGEEARALLRELEARAADAWVSPVALAWIHLGLGDGDAALGELERAHALGAYRVLEIGIDRRWDPVRDHPRFRQVLDAVGLAQGPDSPA